MINNEAKNIRSDSKKERVTKKSRELWQSQNAKMNLSEEPDKLAGPITNRVMDTVREVGWV